VWKFREMRIEMCPSVHLAAICLYDWAGEREEEGTGLDRSIE